MHLVKKPIQLDVGSLRRLYTVVRMDLGQSQYDLTNGLHAMAMMDELSAVLNSGVRAVCGFDAAGRMFTCANLNGRNTIMVEQDDKVYGLYIADPFT